MKQIKYEDGKVTLDLRNLLEGLSVYDTEELADFLSCNDQIIKNVADQLIDGFTDMGSRGATTYTPEKPSTAFDLAKRRIAESSSKIANEEIQSMANRLKTLEKQRDEYSDWAYAMYHAWFDIRSGKNVEFPTDFNKFRKR